MKHFKRILCLLLSVLLVLHAIPTRVNAEDNNKFEIMFGGGNAELNGCILDSIVSISVPDEYGYDNYCDAYAYEITVTGIEKQGEFNVQFSFPDILEHSVFGSFPKLSPIGYSFSDMTPMSDSEDPDDPDDPVIPIDDPQPGDDDGEVIPFDDVIPVDDDEPGEDDGEVIPFDDVIPVDDDEPGDDDGEVIPFDDVIPVDDDEPGDDDGEVIPFDDVIPIDDDESGEDDGEVIPFDDVIPIDDDEPIVPIDDEPDEPGDDLSGYCIPEEQVSQILDTSSYEFNVKLTNGKGQLVLFYYQLQDYFEDWVDGELIVISEGVAPWEHTWSQTTGTAIILNFSLLENEPLQSVEPSIGQIDIMRDLLEGDRLAYLVLPYDVDSTSAILTVKDPAFQVTVNNGSKLSPDQNGSVEVTLFADETPDGKTGGYENTIRVFNGDTLAETYKVIGVSQRYKGLPDSVVDFLCIGSQYTNQRDEAEYGLRAARSLVGSNFDAGGVLTGPVSLGNFGGYITYYYDEAIKDDPNNPYGIDFITFGNSVEGSNEFAEPGQVWVSYNGQDWYALAGSLHYEDSTIWDYTLTYTKSESGQAIITSSDGSTKTSRYEFPDSSLYLLHNFGGDTEAPITVTGISIGAESGASRPLFPEFGYTDVGLKLTVLPEDYDVSRLSNEELAEGNALNVAGNPYLGSYEKGGRVFNSSTDGMDLAWAVDSNGQPVAFPNGIHYVKIVCANNIDAGAIGEKSTEVNMVRVARADSSAVGVSSTPVSIKFDGNVVDLSKGAAVSDNVFSFTGEAAVEVKGAFDVEVSAEGSNIFINNSKGGTASYTSVPDHGIIRVIVQDGEKEPLIYVFSVKAGEMTSDEEDQNAAEVVDRLIEAISDPVTLESKADIDAAREAYDELTDAQKELVTKLDVLVAAEAAYAALAAQDFGTVHVVVENTTYSMEDGAPWEGTLVDTTVALTVDSSMIGAVAQAVEAAGYAQTGASNGYISNINGLAEKDGGADAGWMGMLNDWVTNMGFDSFTVANGKLEGGDEIHIYYTVTGLNTESSDTSLAGLTASVGEFDKAFDPQTLTYTLTVPEGTEEVKLTPTAACKNFYVSIKSGGTEYKRTESIPVEDGTVITLEVGAPTMNTAFTPTTYRVVVAVEAADAVARVEGLIDAIGEVTAESGDAILAARTAYDALSEEDKAKVSNYAALEKAEEDFDALNEAAAEAVADMIDALPETVTEDDKEAIEAARAAYDALTDEQKKLVENYEDLLIAEKALDKLAQAGYEAIYNATGDYIENLIKSDETGLTVNSIGGEWAVVGLARAGRDVPRQDEYLEKVEEFISENANENEQLDRSASTENSRLILALTALGEDVSDAYGHDLVAGLSDLSFVKKQGINGPIWALIALDSHDYEPAEGATATRDALIAEILSAQLEDGGWVLSSTATSSDGDMTGMALQALAPYYDTNAEVKAAVDKALDCLSNMQNAVGGFGSAQGGSATVESSAQVIVALTALGIDPATDERFVKNGISVLDDLCSYFVEGGGFEHVAGGGLDGMATEQGYYALASYFRFKDGQTSLYDMSDVTIGEDEPAEEGPIVKAVDEEGEEIEYAYEEIPEDILLTDAIVVRVNPDIDGDDAFTIIWQMDVTVPDGTEFPVTLTFAIPEEYQDQTIYVYHYNGTDWEVVGEGTGAEVSAEFDELSPVGLVAKASTVPPTGDANDMFLWAGLCVIALAAAAYTVSCGRKRREEI